MYACLCSRACVCPCMCVSVCYHRICRMSMEMLGSMVAPDPGPANHIDSIMSWVCLCVKNSGDDLLRAGGQLTVCILNNAKRSQTACTNHQSHVHHHTRHLRRHGGENDGQPLNRADGAQPPYVCVWVCVGMCVCVSMCVLTRQQCSATSAPRCRRTVYECVYVYACVHVFLP